MFERGAVMTEHPIIGGELVQEAIDEAHLAAIRAKEAADQTRAFVLKHVQKLRGQTMPVEIYSVSNQTHYNCVIVNDSLLLSYVEAEEMITRLIGEEQ